MKLWRINLPQNHQGVALYLFIFAFVTRLPYFFDAVIDWDESTFILLGQSILDGHLPYTELLDVKPPLLWVVFALFLLIFGKTVVSIRFAGTIYVVLTAFFTYLIGRKIWHANIGFISGILFIIATGLSHSGQAVMSEHIALLPLMAAIALLIVRKNTLLNLFFAGTLISTASLIRLNLAYAAIAVGTAILFFPPNSSDRSIPQIIYRGLAYTVGILSIIALTIAPYILLQQQHIWWSSVVEAPLSYSSLQNSTLINLWNQVTAIVNIVLLARPSIGFIGIAIIIWLGGLIQISITLFSWKKLDVFQQRAIILLLFTLLGIEISVMRGGAFFGHYLIQFNAILSLFSAIFIKNTLLTSRHHKTFIRLIYVAFMIAFLHISLKYARLGYEMIANQKILYGSAYEIAEFIQQENQNQEPVLLLSDHLAYWLTDTKPLTPAMTHPSNLNREFFLKAWLGEEASSFTELSKILDKQPKFIIGRQMGSFFTDLSIQENFNQTLSQNYTLLQKINDVDIYKRLR